MMADKSVRLSRIALIIPIYNPKNLKRGGKINGEDVILSSPNRVVTFFKTKGNFPYRSLWSIKGHCAVHEIAYPISQKKYERWQAKLR